MAPFPEGQIWETTDVQERGVHSAELLKTIVHQHRQLVPRLCILLFRLFDLFCRFSFSTLILLVGSFDL